LWPPLIQRELDSFTTSANNQCVRKQKDKILPSGVSLNTAFIFPEKFNGINCIQPVDIAVVDGILREFEEGQKAISDWGVPDEFAIHVKEAHELVGSPKVTVQNVWLVFSAICSIIR